MTTESPAAAGMSRPTSPLLVALAWLVVAIPAGWGVYMTARSAMKLFQPEPAQPITTTSSPTTAK